MSGINGIELIHALRETLHPVQFIVLSGYDDFEYVRGAFQNGAIDYLLKPVLNDDLTRVVAAALSTLDANYRDPGKQRGTLFSVFRRCTSKNSFPADICSSSCFTYYQHGADRYQSELLYRSCCFPDTMEFR